MAAPYWLFVAVLFVVFLFVVFFTVFFFALTPAHTGADKGTIRRISTWSSLAASGGIQTNYSNVIKAQFDELSQLEHPPICWQQFELHNTHMLDTQAIKAQDLRTLSRADLHALIPQLLSHVDEQMLHIGEQRKRLDSAAQDIKWRDAKIEQITFELARLKTWKFGAKSEGMTAQQRELFAETLAADQADLEARLAALQAAAKLIPDSKQPAEKRKPKREGLPEHLPRVDSRVEPENTTCECGQAMQRVGEDISERLDIIAAQFIVQRQIRGKWACKCCQLMLQEPAAVQVFEGGLPTPALQAHTVVSRFVDHVPYYRQETINARSGVHTPRSTLSGWAGQTGGQIAPLFETHRDFILSSVGAASR